MGRQSRSKLILTVGMVLLCIEGRAQQNLVPNPSFEDTVACPKGAGQLWRTLSWQNVGGDGAFSLYHGCASLSCGVPANRSGWQQAREGSAYADIVLAHNNHTLSFHAESNFLGVPMTGILDSGHRYMVEFYLSLMDSVRFAGRNIGVYFSNNVPVNISWSHSAKIVHLLSLTPQVRYEGDFLTDKENWIRIHGDFIAEGGENYMTIGNFDGYFNSDTLNIYEGGVHPTVGYWEVAAYYIDDVSVVEDTSYHVGIGDQLAIANEQLTIYPNPATDVLTIEATGRDMAFELLDVQGKAILRQRLQAQRQNMDVSHLPAGVYVAVLRQQGVAVARRKVVIQR
jgi:hypothetical protein